MTDNLKLYNILENDFRGILGISASLLGVSPLNFHLSVGIEKKQAF